MYWRETCTLCEKRYSTDEEGVMHAADVLETVFCNERAVGANTWSSMYEIGISPVAELEVMTCDYAGQRDVLYKGTWYSIERPTTRGDRTFLVLRHQQSDSAEGGPDGG